MAKQPPWLKGKGGRPKGSKTGTKADRVIKALRKVGIDPFEGMARIAASVEDCRVCDTKGVVGDPVNSGVHLRRKRRKNPIRVFITQADAEQWRDENKHMLVDSNGDFLTDLEIVDLGDAIMRCPQCGGSGKFIAAPELRGRMLSELAQYVEPKKKAMEIGPTGGGSGEGEITFKWRKL